MCSTARLKLRAVDFLGRRLCRQRETSMVKGQEALAAGESGAAAHHFAKATAVTHDMAYAFIKVKISLWLSRRACDLDK